MNFYSQFKEDKWLHDHKKLKEKGFYIDIGAGDGVEFSNTKMLEEMGWSGICVEPDPRSFNELIKNRNSVNLELAVAQKDGSAKMYFCDQYKYLSGLAPTTENVKGDIRHVEAKRLDTLMKEQKVDHIDLLSVDTEGTELDVLNSFELDLVLPEIIIVEYVTQEIPTRKVLEFFEKHTQYEMAWYTEANYIFMLKELYEI